jgi:hypothetical protein
VLPCQLILQRDIRVHSRLNGAVGQGVIHGKQNQPHFRKIVIYREPTFMKGYQFSGFDPNEQNKSTFEKLLDIFMQLLTYTNGMLLKRCNG